VNLRALVVFMLAALLGPTLVAAARRPSPPLVMENADRLEGVRSTGEYILSGNVRFRHGDLRLETQRALWERTNNRVISETPMRITNRGALLTADRGLYDRNADRAEAVGRVFMRDSAGEINATSERLDYDRVKRVAVMSGNPVARRFYPSRLEYPGGDSSAIPEEILADTLTIRALKLQHNDSLGIAIAEGNVVITRRDLRIVCGRAEFRQKEDSLILYEQPVAKVEDSEIRGAVIRLGLKGEALSGLRVRGKAEALSYEKATDSTDARQSRVTGDSLFMAFRDGAVDSVEVFDQAEGTYWEVSKPEYVNRMNGDYMVLRFRDKEAREAQVLGSARSTYYHFEGDTLKGRNRAAGDTIALEFESGRIGEVLVQGRASGVYKGSSLGATVPQDSAVQRVMPGAPGSASPNAPKGAPSGTIKKTVVPAVPASEKKGTP
jgi:lipopolysaccharide export system protein LptA